jgi:hypothetical protein
VVDGQHKVINCLCSWSFLRSRRLLRKSDNTYAVSCLDRIEPMLELSLQCGRRVLVDVAEASKCRVSKILLQKLYVLHEQLLDYRASKDWMGYPEFVLLFAHQ